MELKEDLDNHYQIWQEQINNRDVGLENVLSTVTEKFTIKLKIIDFFFLKKCYTN